MSELPTTGAHLGANSWVASLAPWDESLSEAPGFQHSVTLNSGAGRVLRLHGLRRDTLPLYAHNDACGVIFDGVLFERPALCAKLGLAGDLNLSDAELVLKSYQRDGESFLRQIRGLFAVVIWDSARNICLWARDHLGFFPLYYAQVGPAWLMSTTIDVLRKFPGAPSEIKRIAIVNWLIHRWDNDTLWEGLERLLPGHAALLENHGLKTYHYWDPIVPGKPIEWIEDGAQEQFDKLLDQATTRYLDLGRSGIFLSGGLDSISVAAVATNIARQTDLPLPIALSIAFPGDASERHIQEKVADQLGIPLIILPLEEHIGEEGLLREALELSRKAPWPSMNLWLPAYDALRREARRQGVEIVLTGEGGDEWLGVAPMLAADLIRSFDFVNLYRLWRSATRSFAISPILYARRLIWNYGLRLIVKRAVSSAAEATVPDAFHAFRQRRHLNALPEWIPVDPVLRKQLHERVAQSVAQSDMEQIGSFYLQEVRRALDHPLVSMDVERRFEETRDSGMPILSPYWDVDLVDMLIRTPPRILNGGNRSKGLVRDSLARRFPELGFERQRKVWAATVFRSIIGRDGPAIWRELGGAKALAELGIMESATAEAIAANAFAEQTDIALGQVWHIINFEAWVRSHM